MPLELPRELTLYFARHGQTVANVQKRFSGTKDTPLTMLGLEQAATLGHILKRYPQPHGILFDRPHVVTEAPALLRAPGVEGRVSIERGSFFERVPIGGDAYILSHIIHDWNEEQCLTILGNCRKAMKADGRVLVIDEIITPGKKVPPVIALIDLQLQLLMSGRKRSEAEHRSLFEAAGLQLTQVRPTDSTYTILEATAL